MQGRWCVNWTNLDRFYIDVRNPFIDTIFRYVVSSILDIRTYNRHKWFPTGFSIEEKAAKNRVV